MVSLGGELTWDLSDTACGMVAKLLDAGSFRLPRLNAGRRAALALIITPTSGAGGPTIQAIVAEQG